MGWLQLTATGDQQRLMLVTHILAHLRFVFHPYHTSRVRGWARQQLHTLPARQLATARAWAWKESFSPFFLPTNP
jgi:hypothetical protein